VLPIFVNFVILWSSALRRTCCGFHTLIQFEYACGCHLIVSLYVCMRSTNPCSVDLTRNPGTGARNVKSGTYGQVPPPSRSCNVKTDELRKCDQSHPICAHCRGANQWCSFLGSDSSCIVQTASPSHLSVAAPSTVSTTASTPPQTPRPETTKDEESLDPHSVNLIHIELFHNLDGKEFRSFESESPDNLPTTIYIEYAVTTPYLMYQILAISALHLSTKSANSQDHYRGYATGLQCRALSLFKESNHNLEVLPANSSPMFLFSSSVSVHLLCDTLYYQRNSLENFVSGFAGCMGVCRGVLAIVSQCVDMLGQTELGPRLQKGRMYRELMKGSGSECNGLLNMVDTIVVTPKLRKVYREAVTSLQQAFDRQRGTPGKRVGINVLISWPIHVSPEYVEMLQQWQGEALTILAHYAVLLHRGRDMWVVGDGGRFLIESICERLDQNWQEWLKFPKAALGENLTA
jgi:hypothetical protein